MPAPVSQFENHIRAVAGWPLGATERHSDARMQNLIGAEAGDWAQLAAEPGACLHLYGKGEARPGRKMGHVTWIKARSGARLSRASVAAPRAGDGQFASPFARERPLSTTNAMLAGGPAGRVCRVFRSCRSTRGRHRLQVLVRDNNVDQALKALKKKMQREGIFREMKLRNYFEKPSERKARERAEAVRRARKLARKRAAARGTAARQAGGGYPRQQPRSGADRRAAKRPSTSLSIERIAQCAPSQRLTGAFAFPPRARARRRRSSIHRKTSSPDP